MKKKKSNILDYPRKGLDPNVWEESTGLLKQNHHAQLLNKLYAFFIDQGFEHYSEWVNDVIVIGALTSYQYNNHTDLDIHVQVDVPKFIKFEHSNLTPDALHEVMNEEWRDVLNKVEVEMLSGTQHPIEIYFETFKTTPHYTDGIYSLMKNTWLKEPRTVDLDFDPEKVFSDVFGYIQEVAKEFDIQIGIVYRELKDIDLLLESINSLETSQKIILKSKLEEKFEKVESEIKDLVEKGREIKEKKDEDYDPTSKENLTFKYLARFGYLYVIHHLKELYEDDAQITEDEVEKALQIIQDHGEGSAIVSRFIAKITGRKS